MKIKLLIFILFLLISLNNLTAQMIGTGFGSHSIVVNNNGITYSWGANTYGQLGNSSNTSSNTPIDIHTYGALQGKYITQVAMGGNHSIALATNGRVYSWGDNTYGQLGNGDNSTSYIPVAVDITGVLSGKTIIQVAAGRYHSMALASDGTVYTWGRNNFGQLGDGNTSDRNVPVAVYSSGALNGKSISKIAAGGYHSIALASDGSVFTWGNNYYGELGNGNNNNYNVPVAVSGGISATQIAGGDYHSLALGTNGLIYAWGYNNEGELGNNSSLNSNVPVTVYNEGILWGLTINKIAAGGYHSMALASNGLVYDWGYNYYGQLGDGTNTNKYVPVAVSTSGVLNGKTITSIASGLNHSIALSSDGNLYAWGEGSSGELGNGSNITSYVPVQVNQSGMGPLPVELLSFSAKVNNNSVKLEWQTATEVNNYGFEILRRSATKNDSHSETDLSVEESHWKSLSFVKGNNNSNAPKTYTFTDNTPPAGKVQYRLKQIDNDGSFKYSDVIEINVGVPARTELYQNYPNPFNPITSIPYTLSKDGLTLLKIYDIIGNEVKTLINEKQHAGKYQINFNGSELPSGVYLYKLQCDEYLEIRKLILMK